MYVLLSIHCETAVGKLMPLLHLFSLCGGQWLMKAIRNIVKRQATPAHATTWNWKYIRDLSLTVFDLVFFQCWVNREQKSKNKDSFLLIHWWQNLWLVHLCTHDYSVTTVSGFAHLILRPTSSVCRWIIISETISAKAPFYIWPGYVYARPFHLFY